MPAIRELAGLKDGRYGFCRDSQGQVHGAEEADVIAYVAEHSQMLAGAFERFVETKCSIPGSQVAAHCFSKEPLRLAFNVANEGAQIDDDWWKR